MITEIKNIEEELDCRINIKFRPFKWGVNNEFWGVQIDNTITPLYCCNCENQLEYFYKLDGGRYGFVGIVKCNCGANINCNDSDNIVEYLDTTTTLNGNLIGKFNIDFVNLYQLNNNSFLKIKEYFNFDIYSEYHNQTIDLKEIIHRLEIEYRFHLSEVKQHTYEKINKLPFIVNKWLSILTWIEENPKKKIKLEKDVRSWWKKIFSKA